MITGKMKFFDGIIWAVFNCHDGDLRKGRKAVLSKYGMTGWRKVKTINRTGVMAMFNTSMIPETELYADTIATSADERCMKRELKKKGNIK